MSFYCLTAYLPLTSYLILAVAEHIALARYVIDAKGAIRKCTVCLTDEKNKVGEIIDRENFHMNFYALSQWTECKLSLVEGNTECRFNKQAVYRHIELVADMLYNKRMLNQPK